MITPEIRDAYPHVSKEDIDQLSPDDFNKLSIKFHEDAVRDYKTALGDLFKNKSIDYPEWYKDLLRERKSTHERMLKETVFAQGYLREGLNPPYFYAVSEGNPYGFVKKKVILSDRQIKTEQP